MNNYAHLDSITCLCFRLETPTSPTRTTLFGCLFGVSECAFFIFYAGRTTGIRPMLPISRHETTPTRLIEVRSFSRAYSLHPMGMCVWASRSQTTPLAWVARIREGLEGRPQGGAPLHSPQAGLGRAHTRGVHAWRVWDGRRGRGAIRGKQPLAMKGVRRGLEDDASEVTRREDLLAAACGESDRFMVALGGGGGSERFRRTRSNRPSSRPRY